MTDESTIIEARGLALGYGRTPLLRAVDWTVRRGESWFLLGPNGRGKSTLLKGVLSQLPPLDGSLHVHPARTAIGFVPQRCDLNPALPTTVREFTALGLVGLRVPRAEIPARVETALAHVHLADRMQDSYWSLSGGQRQRALLARALIRRPELLILDEPTNGLDLTSEESLLSCLETLRHESALAILFVTHDLELARRHASHVLLFGEGHVRPGRCDAILTPDNLRATFDAEAARV